jgi:SAM-dependent methyltransferase
VEGRRADVVHAYGVAEFYTVEVAAVFAADSYLQLGAGFAALVDAPAHQQAYAFGVEGLEGVGAEDAGFLLVNVIGEEAAGVISRETHRRLREVVGAEGEEFGADATKLEGLENRFDTVVDCAFYHTFSTEPELQHSYAQALHRATKPGARLYMFEFGVGNVNGFQMPRSLSEDDFRQVFPDAGWQITYLGPTTYVINMSMETLELMLARNPDMADQFKPLVERFRIIEPWLTNGRAYAPFWAMHATRVD